MKKALNAGANTVGVYERTELTRFFVAKWGLSLHLFVGLVN
jgi:hypothetical protein